LDGSRDSESLYGIFPKHQPRGSSKQEQERKAKAEEDEKKKIRGHRIGKSTKNSRIGEKDLKEVFRFKFKKAFV
jgi:hypothetical protein